MRIRNKKKTETACIKENSEGIFMWLKFSTIITREANANFYGQFPHTCTHTHTHTHTHTNIPKQKIKFLHFVLLYRTGRKDEKEERKERKYEGEHSGY